MTPEQLKSLALCTPDERKVLRRRWSQKAWAARWRSENPDVARSRQAQLRRMFVELGYYRKGGKYYRPHDPANQKRLDYFRRYNANRRAKAEAQKAIEIPMGNFIAEAVCKHLENRP